MGFEHVQALSRSPLCLGLVVLGLIVMAGLGASVVVLRHLLMKEASRREARLREQLHRDGRVRLELDDVAVRLRVHATAAVFFRRYRGGVTVADDALYLFLRQRSLGGRVVSPRMLRFGGRAEGGGKSKLPTAVEGELRTVEKKGEAVILRGVGPFSKRVVYHLRTPRAEELVRVLAALVPDGGVLRS